MEIENLQAGEAAPMAPPKPPKVRMDKGREFATVHGERTADDPFKLVHFMQDGLPYDAHGMLLLNHQMLTDGTEEAEQLQRIAMKRIKRQLAIDARAATRKTRHADADADDDDAEVEDVEDAEEDEQEPINLSMWLRGEQDVVWNEVSQHIARTYKKRVNSIADAVVFLVKEGVAPSNAVARKFKKFLD
jgi:hypothetical protein